MFDLHTLGWNSFQQLCLTISRELLGQTVESFLDTNDGGRDGSFTGTWKQINKENLSGKFVIQCKFTSKSGYNLRPSDISKELSKIKHLVKRNMCDVYILMTNAGLSGKNAEEIYELIQNAGAKQVRLLGSTWINQQILESQRLRMLVPRVYGLGDLTQILDERAYTQARSILESLREDLAKVVVTDAYQKAAAALDKYNFVLLIGEPAAGKTTIASMLAMSAVDKWDASMLKLDHPNNVVEHWNPSESSQFFWIDDAFGVTQYESFLVHGWNHALQQVKSMLRTGAKIVMASRDYIYARARKELKIGAFPLLNESQVVVDVHNLSDIEKRQILYNHLKLGKQSRSFLKKAKPYLEGVALHERFSPETARRLADPLFTKNLYCDAENFREFVEKRESHLNEVLQGLDGHSKAALALIYMNMGHLQSPLTLQDAEERALERLSSDVGKSSIALESLNGSLVLHSLVDGDQFWSFKHPTIGDAYASILAESPELLEIFILGSTPDKLIQQVTCGDVGIENAVIIPRVLFPLIIDKLHDITDNKAYKTPLFSQWKAKDRLHRFLAFRCSRQFLELYIQGNLHILESISEPGLFLHAVSEVSLAIHLHEFGLLPEDNRDRFISKIREYAIQGDDLFGIDHAGIRTLFKDQEYNDLLHDIETELIPSLHTVTHRWQFNYDSDESPEQHMSPLLDSFDILLREFKYDLNAKNIIECEIQYVRDWIDEQQVEEGESIQRDFGQVNTIKDQVGSRSIFDDIDE